MQVKKIQVFILVSLLFQLSICIPPQISQNLKLPNISKHPIILRNLEMIVDNLDNHDMISQKEFLKVLQQQLKEGSRNEDHEMCQDIAEDFISENKQDQYHKQDIKRLIIDENKLFYYVENWKIRMYMYLIEQYQMEQDQDFLTEVMNDPEYFGIDYDSYKILKFNLIELKNKQ